MKFVFQNARWPCSADLLRDLSAAAVRFKPLMKDVDVDALDVSDYIRRYFRNYVKSINSVLYRFVHMLAHALAEAGRSLEDVVLVDYGGGTGWLSLFARELGIGTVIYVDIYDQSCRDARVIGDHVDRTADFYVEGDERRLQAFLEEQGLACHALISNNVVEHIYDLPGFYRTLEQVSQAPFCAVMASSANGDNPRLRRQFTRKHLHLELEDRAAERGRKESDKLTAYRTIRRQMIAEHAPSLSAADTEKLAAATRGLIRADILTCVDEYLGQGTISYTPAHPTNTCDPLTGNGAENLFNLKHLAQQLTQIGFRVDLIKGYASGKKLPQRLVNHAVNFCGSYGMRFSPYYMVCTSKTGRTARPQSSV